MHIRVRFKNVGHAELGIRTYSYGHIHTELFIRRYSCGVIHADLFIDRSYGLGHAELLMDATPTIMMNLLGLLESHGAVEFELETLIDHDL